jgi:hypothetical protein
METMTKRAKLKVDLMAELDKAMAEMDNPKAHETRSAVGRAFSRAAERAGWSFRHEVWPVKNLAVSKAVNADYTGLTSDEMFDKENMIYIEELSKYCES